MIKFSRLIQQFQSSQFRRYRASSERNVCISTTKQQLVLIFLRGEWHPTLLWPNGWMDEDATNWYGSRPRHRPHCRRVSSAARKGHSTPPPSFRPMSIVATVAHLSYTAELLCSDDSYTQLRTDNPFLCSRIRGTQAYDYRAPTIVKCWCASKIVLSVD